MLRARSGQYVWAEGGRPPRRPQQPWYVEQIHDHPHSLTGAILNVGRNTRTIPTALRSAFRSGEAGELAAGGGTPHRLSKGLSCSISVGDR